MVDRYGYSSDDDGHRRGGRRGSEPEIIIMNNRASIPASERNNSRSGVSHQSQSRSRSRPRSRSVESVHYWPNITGMRSQRQQQRRSARLEELGRRRSSRKNPRQSRAESVSSDDAGGDDNNDGQDGKNRLETYYATILPSPEIEARASSVFLPQYRGKGKPQPKSLWHRAGRRIDSNNRRGLLVTDLQFVVLRRGKRLTSRSVQYTKGANDDEWFGKTLEKEYRLLKTQLSFVQKVISYKTVAFVYFLQWRVRPNNPWEVTSRLPVLSLDKHNAEDHFRYRLKYPLEKDRTWMTTLDSLVVMGSVVDVEIKETFDVTKVFWGVTLAVLLSLAAGLGYGFGMNHDFSTGFAISSWLLTVFAFYFAVIAAGEWFGLKKFSETHTINDDIEEGYRQPPGASRYESRRYDNAPDENRRYNSAPYESRRYESLRYEEAL